MKDHVLILGAGAWGTALAIILHRNGHAVEVWGHDPEYTLRIQTTRENSKFLPGVALPAAIRFEAAPERLSPQADIVVSVVPTQFLRAATAEVAAAVPPGAPVVSGSKGFERGTYLLPSQILRERFPQSSVAVLSGPSHAEEVSRGLPAALVVAGGEAEVPAQFQRALSGPRLRVYTSADPLGVEVGGAAKNVIALAAGISDGLGFGDNARAALLTRGLHEITRLGVALGGRAETFAGLTGMGDLVATATSEHSRNRAVGIRLARGETLAGILGSVEKVAEGVETARSIHELSRKLNVELPIAREVSAVLFENKPPRRAVEDLMERESKGEQD
ncbi:MAG TPA: NAD(P)H-dependent glycerol-3-phosphate dehydrogenase [Planctomycetota bacterium]|nr:NAD(P)H-dependent glycerol-3-phosphate dehydrogenase [Planctomycetota bacterium]